MRPPAQAPPQGHLAPGDSLGLSHTALMQEPTPITSEVPAPFPRCGCTLLPLALESPGQVGAFPLGPARELQRCHGEQKGEQTHTPGESSHPAKATSVILNLFCM